VLATATFSDFELPDFKARRIGPVTVSRESAKIGKERVDYTFSFQTPNYISEGSTFRLFVPVELAILEKRDLSCEDGHTRKRMTCTVHDSSDNDTQVVEVKEKCNHYNGDNGCTRGSEISIKVKLTNPSDLSAVLNSVHNINLQAYTKNGEFIQYGESEDPISPPLEGLELENLIVERKSNMLGA